MASVYWVVALKTEDWAACDWCPEPDLQDSVNWDDRARQWVFAMYWATATGQGSPLAWPETNLQATYSMIVLVIGLIVNASLIGSISKLMENFDEERADKKAKRDAIDQSLRYRKVPGKLQNKILNYYDYLWESGDTAQDDELFKDLPKSLRIQLDLFLKHHLIEKVPLFQMCTTAGIVELVQSLVSVVVTPGEVIVHQGEHGNEMFFVTRGHVRIFQAFEDGSESFLTTLPAGSFFGEIALLDPDSTRSASVKSSSYCELQVLRRESFDNVLERFPDFKREVRIFAQKRQAASAERAKEEAAKHRSSLRKMSINVNKARKSIFGLAGLQGLPGFGSQASKPLTFALPEINDDVEEDSDESSTNENQADGEEGPGDEKVGEETKETSSIVNDALSRRNHTTHHEESKEGHAEEHSSKWGVVAGLSSVLPKKKKAEVTYEI